MSSLSAKMDSMTNPLESIQVTLYALQNELPDRTRTASADQLHRLQIQLETEIGLEVGRLRRDGVSWARIGQVFGLSSSGAQSKWRWYAPRERHRQPSGYRSTYKPIPGDDLN